MKLEIFNAHTRMRVDLIRTYNYVTYTHELYGEGYFELRIPTTEQTLTYLQFGAYIYFDDGVVGVVKGKKDTENSDVEVTIYGYLTKHILSYRSFLLTEKYYDKPNVVVRDMVTDLFINPEDIKRRISFITLSDNIKYNPTLSNDNETFQNTGDTAFTVISRILEEYGCSFDLYPVIDKVSLEDAQPNLKELEFRIIKPVDRTIDNTDGNEPVLFSFDLDNLSQIDYEEDGRAYNTIAVVASYGEGQERKVIEVGETEKTGIDRIELYVDARDLQPNQGVSEEWVEDYVDDQFGELINGQY